MKDRKTRGVLLGVLALLVLMGSVFVPQAKATKVTLTSNGYWTVPAGVTSITVKAWGAGGGGGGGEHNGNGYSGGAGGGGGYATGTMSTTPGEQLYMYVGGGGTGGPTHANRGDLGCWDYPSGGGGGGYSGVERGSTYLLIAPGGGGGGSAGYSSGSAYAGGAGGGSTGSAGAGPTNPGGGGTSSGGGAAGDMYGTAGSAYQGGYGTNYYYYYAPGGTYGGGYGSLTCSGYGSGGGGGGGRYGGGGGGYAYYGVANGGGGGSSYFDGSVSGQSTTGGSGTTPGNSGDSDHASGKGVGGAGGPADNDGTTGGDGYVVISYTAATAVKRMSLSARQSPEGVLIEWRTGYEVHNLGFHVYRGYTRLTKEPLVGSALFAGQETVLRAGNSYSWFDPGHAEGPYWVEDIDLSGTRTMHGPIVPVPAQGPLPRKTALFLSHLSRQMPLAPFPFKIWRMLFGGPDFPGAAPDPQETQWILAQSAAMKLLVRQEGWYRITATQLAQAGFHIRQPKFLQLYVDGEEQPLLVTPTGIEFYATGVDTQWTDTRTYWLVNGSAPGKRIEQTGGASRASGASSFPYSIEQKQRLFYVSALLNGDAQNFFGMAITQEPASVAFTVAHKASGDGALELLLQGLTDGVHQVTVTLNGYSLGSVAMDGMKQGHALLPVPASQLVEGVNQVGLVSSAPMDISAVDTLRLTYPHTYTADGDHLRCTAIGGTVLTLAGFTKPVRVFDVTDPQGVKEVAGQPQKEGIRLTVPGTGERTLLAVTEPAVQTPQLSGNIPSSWHANHRADLVIITHGDFTRNLAPLVQLRQSQGLSVALVDVEDLYDEFSFGMKTPDAIKAFLSWARSWRTPPRYVLLVGGATYDPRNFTGSGDLDFIPTRLVDTAMIETASDDWFVDFNGDGLPEIPIGRLPVDTARETATVVAKFIAYEQSTPSTKAIYVADIGDGMDDFEGALKFIEPLVSLTPEELFRSSLGAQTGPDLVTALNQGAALVTYLGHGSVQLWDGYVLDTPTVDTLTNTTLPFFINLTCLTGYFITPTCDSLADALMTDSGGGIGVIASSALTEFAPQAAFGTALFGDLFTGATVGEALVAAKRVVTDPDVRKSYLLFGDPSMKVRR